ncbi:MAG: MBL fold metallo-hydrolase [archaeon]
MAEVKVLIKGYVRGGEFELATSTTTLIKDGNIKIIVDPGMNKKLLLKSLEKENLSPKDIDYVILTHTHLDHCLLAGIFENAKIVDSGSVYSFDSKIKNHDGKVPETDIEIINTPGHDEFHCSVVVQDDKLGKVVIASDVFWWDDNEEQKTDKKSLLKHVDPYVKDKNALKKSREQLLNIADYIIPGHGEMFKVEK